MFKYVNIIIIGCSSGSGKHLAITYCNYQNVYKNESGFNNFANILVKNAGSEDWNGIYTRVEDISLDNVIDDNKYKYIKEGDKNKYLFCNNENSWILSQQCKDTYYISKSSSNSDTEPPIDGWKLDWDPILLQMYQLIQRKNF